MDDEVDDRGFWLYGEHDGHTHDIVWSAPLCVSHCRMCGITADDVDAEDEA